MNTLIVLVNWKRAEDTCACLESLMRLNRQDWSAVICDNASPDGSADLLAEFLSSRFSASRRIEGASGAVTVDVFSDDADPSWPKVTLVRAGRNLGFAAGNNLAFRCAPGATEADFVWFLNNDTEVEAHSLDHLLERMRRDESIGICGATLVYEHDRRTVQALGGASYAKWTGAVAEIGHSGQWPCVVDPADVERRMDYVSGASMFVSRALIERVGLMSEDYFLYYEEIDWAERARRHGFCLGYAPDAVVFHKEGAVLGSGHNAQRSALAEYYGLRNRLRVTRKFFPWALPTVYLFSMAQVLRRVLQGRWARARMMVAVLTGLRNTAPES